MTNTSNLDICTHASEHLLTGIQYIFTSSTNPVKKETGKIMNQIHRTDEVLKPKGQINIL